VERTASRGVEVGRHEAAAARTLQQAVQNGVPCSGSVVAYQSPPRERRSSCGGTPPGYPDLPPDFYVREPLRSGPLWPSCSSIEIAKGASHVVFELTPPSHQPSKRER
jgi:hypothetical protein